MTNSFDEFFYSPTHIPRPGSLHAFFENVPGGLQGLLNFISMSATEEAFMGEILALAESCLAHKKSNWDLFETRILYWEKLCEHVEITPLEFRTAVMNQVDLYSSQLSHLQSIGAQPELVRTSIAVGLIPSDKTFNDRKAQFLHNKFVPVPTTTITATSTVQNLQVNAAPVVSFPSFEQLADQSLKAIVAEEPLQLGPAQEEFIDEDDDDDDEDELEEVLVERKA